MKTLNRGEEDMENLERENLEKKREYQRLLEENRELKECFNQLVLQEMKRLNEISENSFVGEKYEFNKVEKRDLKIRSEQLTEKKQRIASLDNKRREFENEKEAYDERISKLQKKREELTQVLKELNDKENEE